PKGVRERRGETAETARDRGRIRGSRPATLADVAAGTSRDRDDFFLVAAAEARGVDPVAVQELVEVAAVLTGLLRGPADVAGDPLQQHLEVPLREAVPRLPQCQRLHGRLRAYLRSLLLFEDEVVRLDPLSRAAHHRLLERVLELPDVPGPGVG